MSGSASPTPKSGGRWASVASSNKFVFLLLGLVAVLVCLVLMMLALPEETIEQRCQRQHTTIEGQQRCELVELMKTQQELHKND